MNSELQSQTDLLLKALEQLHKDLVSLNYTTMIVAALLFAVLLIVAIRRRGA